MEELQYALKNLKWDIIEISETRLPGEKCITLKSKHILYHKNSEEDSHIKGVGFLINKNIKHQITKVQAISERVIYLTIQHTKRYTLQIIQIYAPTSKADDEEVLQLYEDITKARKIENAK